MSSDIDSDLNTFAKPRQVSFLAGFERLLKSFSAGDRLLLYVLSVLLAVSVLALVAGAAYSVSSQVPAHGGHLTEGELGPARFINPLIAMSQADDDLTALVYSGLMRATPEGSYISDLASSYDISPDGTTYTFHLRTNATFQDGKPVTADDVLFTVSLAQNPDIKSVHRADWEGVSASAPDAHTVVFTLPHAYAPFIENTTLGILPKHLWQNVTPEEFPFSPLNTRPVGSGPYRVSNVDTDQTGAATRYDLTAFHDFALGTPYVSGITFLFYPNQDALESAWSAHRIEAMAALTPTSLSDLTRTDANITSSPLPRTFGIFFNQNHNKVLADAAVRSALDAATDKDYLVKNVLGGFGLPLSGPIPPSALQGTAATPTPLTIPVIASTTPSADAAANARAILTRGGWKFTPTATTTPDVGTWTKGKDTLSLTIATADEPELVATANDVAAMWRAAGVQVNVQVYPLADLNTTIIRPRNYDALLFGEVVGRSLDLFAFWHSSQRNDPGLNLAMYANSKTDTLLAQARATTDSTAREKLYGDFADLLNKDTPAVFLYSPDFLYITPSDLRGVKIGALTTPSERFLNVYQWYTNTRRVWNVFSQ